jgi:hypothetical protein
LKVVVAWPPPAMFQYVTVCTIRYVGINWTCNPLALIKHKWPQLLTLTLVIVYKYLFSVLEREEVFLYPTSAFKLLF